MLNTVRILILFMFIGSVYGQHSGFKAELNYPISVGDNVLGKHYKGLIGVGASYNLFQINNIDISIKGNLDIARFSEVKLTTFKINPKIIVGTKISKFNPYLGLGYSFYEYSESNTKLEKKSEKGPSILLGCRYFVTCRIYTFGSYEFTKLDHDGEWSDVPYNREMHTIKVGVGLAL